MQHELLLRHHPKGLGQVQPDARQPAGPEDQLRQLIFGIAWKESNMKEGVY